MRLGILLGYSGAKLEIPVDFVQTADEMGVHIIWTAEAYGSDAVTPLAWLAAQTKNIHLGTAIMQMQGRTPANTTMTAITLDQLSGGRFKLGLGLSGPQVIEGWHGQPYPKRVLSFTREYVGIVRQILAREKPMEIEGEYYQIPYKGEGASGLGKPLKSILHGRLDLPIYIAAIGPKNVQLAAEIADGWLPIFFAPEKYDTAFREDVEAGFAAAGPHKGYHNFDIAAPVTVVMGDDVSACLNQVKPFVALYVGGMGAKSKNFYYTLACRYGFQEAADAIQAAYLSGNKWEAVGMVPDELVDMIALCGPEARIRERFELWRKAPITTLNLTMTQPDTAVLKLMMELVSS